MTMFQCQSSINGIVDLFPEFNGGVITGADESDPFADQVEAASGRFYVDGLDCIGFIDDASDPMQYEITDLVVLDQCVE